ISSCDSVSAKSMDASVLRVRAQEYHERRACPTLVPPLSWGAMETTPAIQDYLGAIYDLAGSDKPVVGARLARYMHLSAPSITEEAEADRQLLRFLWESGVRPGIRLTVGEVAPFAGTISIVLEGRTVTMGLAASHKIWVYDPARPVERPTARRARARRGH